MRKTLYIEQKYNKTMFWKDKKSIAFLHSKSKTILPPSEYYNEQNLKRKVTTSKLQILKPTQHLMRFRRISYAK